MDPERLLPVLICEDDEEDCKLAQKAMKESRVLNEFILVEDGEELLDYLHKRGKHKPAAGPPRSQKW